MRIYAYMHIYIYIYTCIHIQIYTSMHELNSSSVAVSDQIFLWYIPFRWQLWYSCSMAKLSAAQFEVEYGDIIRREYAEYQTPRALLRALEHRQPRIMVSEGVLKVWFSKQVFCIPAYACSCPPALLASQCAHVSNCMPACRPPYRPSRRRRRVRSRYQTQQSWIRSMGTNAANSRPRTPRLINSVVLCWQGRRRYVYRTV